MSLLVLLTTITLVAVILAALAMIFDWHPVDNAKRMWRWWTVRLQALSAVLTGWLFFDPQAMLYTFNLLPNHVRAAMPESVATALSWVGGLIFVLNLLSIVARGVAQPKART